MQDRWRFIDGTGTKVVQVRGTLTSSDGEVLRASVEALRANKFRAFLTALGLVIGNASVILVVTISLTSRDYVLDQIQAIGSNMIYAQFDGGNNPAMAVDP